MRRSASSVQICVVAAVAALAWPIAVARGADKPETFTTPQEVWDAYQRAVAEGHFGVAFECLTPGAQEEHLERCILNALMLVGEPRGGDGMPKEIASLCDRLEKVMRSHGMDPKEVTAAFEAAHKKAELTDVDLSEEASRALLVGRMKGDRKSFFDETMSVIFEI